MKLLVLFIGKKFKVAGKQELIFGFTGGAHGNLKEARKFCIGSTSAAFGDIGWNGHACTANLRSQSVQFFLGEAFRYFVYSQCELMCFFPHFEFAEIFHKRNYTSRNPRLNAEG